MKISKSLRAYVAASATSGAQFLIQAPRISSCTSCAQCLNRFTTLTAHFSGCLEIDVLWRAGRNVTDLSRGKSTNAFTSLPFKNSVQIVSDSRFLKLQAIGLITSLGRFKERRSTTHVNEVIDLRLSDKLRSRASGTIFCTRIVSSTFFNTEQVDRTEKKSILSCHRVSLAIRVRQVIQARQGMQVMQSQRSKFCTHQRKDIDGLRRTM